MPLVVCVPARNEEKALPSLLQALAGLATAGQATTVCIYLDGCHDGSAALLRQAAAQAPFRLVTAAGAAGGEANAGIARHAAVQLGLETLGDRDGCLFITDADSAPRADWIAAGRAALDLADVAAGRIVRRNAGADAGQSRIEAYYDRLHRYRRSVDPVPWEARDSHHYASGANIAVRAATYRRIGGFRPLATGEDATFLDDAARAGFRVRRDGAMVVETSSRRHGRAPDGLAGALRALDAGQSQQVPHPREAAWQWRAQAAARAAFAGIPDVDVRATLGERLGLTADHVLGVARDCPNAEAFAMRIVPAFAALPELVSLKVAEDALEILEGEWCGMAA